MTRADAFIHVWSVSIVVALTIACRDRAMPLRRDAHVVDDPWDLSATTAVDARTSGDAGLACVDRAAAATAWQHALPTIDVVQQPPPGPPELIEDDCWKQVYRYGRYRLAVTRNAWGKPRLHATSKPAASQVCMDETIERAVALVPYARAILDAARAQQGDRWTDPDVGARSWFDCSAPTFATALHELNHSLTHGSCLHDPGGTPYCFEGLDALPARRIAFVKDLQLPHARKARSEVDAAQTYDGLQRVYLEATGHQGALSLLDEVLAYTISADVQAAVVGAGDEMNDIVGLPMIALATMRYWELVQRDQPAEFARVMGRDTKNRATLLRLLATSERSFEQWRKVRGKRPSGMRAFTRAEDILWTRYLANKRRVLASD